MLKSKKHTCIGAEQTHAEHESWIGAEQILAQLAQRAQTGLKQKASWGQHDPQLPSTVGTANTAIRFWRECEYMFPQRAQVGFGATLGAPMTHTPTHATRRSLRIGRARKSVEDARAGRAQTHSPPRGVELDTSGTLGRARDARGTRSTALARIHERSGPTQLTSRVLQVTDLILRSDRPRKIGS